MGSGSGVEEVVGGVGDEVVRWEVGDEVVSNEVVGDEVVRDEVVRDEVLDTPLPCVGRGGRSKEELEVLILNV